MDSGAPLLHHFVANALAVLMLLSYLPHMENFKNLLQQEFLRRVSKNPHYSLRAYAQFLGIHHATLSTLVSGKRKITIATVNALSKKLGLTPEEVNQYLQRPVSDSERDFYLLQNDVFALISDWYFDAILEMSLVPRITLEAKTIASLLNISVLQASLALEVLERLSLLKLDAKGKYVMTYKNSTNILDPETTSSAQKKYQRAILEKSLDALENIDRRKRDHTSMTMAINGKDLPAAKDLIKKFRHDLNAYMQRHEPSMDEVYQLQISFFPLTGDSPRSSYEN